MQPAASEGEDESMKTKWENNLLFEEWVQAEPVIHEITRELDKEHPMPMVSYGAFISWCIRRGMLQT